VNHDVIRDIFLKKSKETSIFPATGST
jgi:hypothetical protein